MGANFNKRFVFKKADDFYTLVCKIIDDIKQTDITDDKLILKLKLILVELLTNSIKHSGNNETYIEIEINKKYINIIKTDTGNGLTIRNSKNLLEWPLPGRHYNNQIISIYNDNAAFLNGKLINNCKMSFFVVEIESEESIVFDKLTEHFGLMIITRACDEFYYEFDIETLSNRFIASIALK